MQIEKHYTNTGGCNVSALRCWIDEIYLSRLFHEPTVHVQQNIHESEGIASEHWLDTLEFITW